MKNNLPLWVIAVSLTFIVILMPLQDASAAAGPIMQGTTTTASTTTINILFDVITFNPGGSGTDWITCFAVTNPTVAISAGTTLNTDQDLSGLTTITITVAAMPTDATPTVTYTAGNCAAGNLAHDAVGAQAMANDDQVAADGVAPTVVSAATTSPTTIALTMSEIMVENANNPADFVVSGVTGNTVSSFVTSGSTITLTLTGTTILSTNAITVAYTGTADNDLEDAAPGSNDLADFTGQAVTNLITPTGGSDDIPPSFVTTFDEDEYPISIGDTKFTFAELGFNNPTTTVEIGKPIRVNLLMYDNSGPTYIHQVEFYTNTRGAFSSVSNSDTSIIYKSGNPRIVLDPNGFFSDVTLTSSIVNQKLQLTFDITFAKEMEKSDIIIQARDTGNSVGVLTVSDAWQVIQPQAVEDTAEPSTDESTDDSIPDEIKVKTLNVEKSAYSVREEILFFGTVDGYKFGSVVGIIIRNPSNGFLTLISTFPDKDGYFEAKIVTDSKFKTDGTYTATAFTDDPNKGTQTIFYFSRATLPPPPPPPVTTSPVQSTQAEQSTESEPITTSEPVTPKPKPMPSFVDPEKDPQSYVDRYNNEASYKEWFDGNYPDYTIYEAVGLAEPITIEQPKTTAAPTQQEPKTVQETKTETSEPVCGPGTVLKNSQCVPEHETMTTEMQQKSSGGGCLIATATYGSELAPQVQQLREIRDNSLLQTESGSAFMKSFNQFYYSFSPVIADLERENPVFKEAVKLTITPLLSSLSLLNYVDMDSEVEVLGYGISLIMLNVGMYFVLPAVVIHRLRKFV